VPFYRKVVGDRVIVCPSLGADSTIEPAEVKRDIDLLICGYAYPSRKKFVRQLLPLLRTPISTGDLRITLVGDVWWELKEALPENVTVMPTQPLRETYDLHRRARAVVCLHRVAGDCSDGPVAPETVNRGFLEGYCGARVFVDVSRPHHDFDEGEVVWFANPNHLAKLVREYLEGGDTFAAKLHAETFRQIRTYRTRLARVLNCVRAPRFLAEIP